MSGFTHLHLHTQYSLLDGYAKIEPMLDRVKELGMDSVAITDHGSMFGVIEFYKQAKKRGIKPIIGCEVYVTPGNYLDKGPNDKTRHHLILLAKNQTGYQNLIKIVSEGYVNGFYYKPRVDKSILQAHSEGIICLSACLGGHVPRLLRENQYDQAKQVALDYAAIFGQGNYYLELQDHGIVDQKRVNLDLARISKETGIPLVATNDVHFTDKEDFKVHDVLLCIQTGAKVSDENRMRFPNDQFYVKSEEEMARVFSNYPQAIANTKVIADACNVDFTFHELKLPHFDLPEGYTNASYLRELVEEGIYKKYDKVDQDILDRMNFELKTIEDMGFIDYFLIVWDFIRYAKNQGIPVGPGRGSAAGSIISYALDITGIDPLAYDLLFERFLNPERVSMPDIDIDFCYERRDEVIDYVNQKYGQEKVAQIVTFGSMAARNAIRDVGRALDIDYNKVDKLAKQVPTTLGMTLEQALEVSSDFKQSYSQDIENKEIIDIAMAVEGMPRHTSTHAAGVVIASEAVDHFVPLSRNGDQVTTQYNMIELEELGLLKMDFLGLRTLTVIQDAIDLIKYNHDIDLDIAKIDLNDPKVIQIFHDAHTIGIFQFESEGMRNFLSQLKPSRFDDLIAANSLFRPGPMNEIPNYVKNRHQPERVTYLHESLEDILDVTYGTIVFQEQVIQIVQKLAGFSLGEADNLRRAMGKKNMQVMEENRAYFVHGRKDENGHLLVPGCIRNGINEDIANQIYDLMIDFAKYAFNKSHSAAYSVVAMQTAYLKVYYPTEFMAALLSSVMNDTTKVQLYIKEAKRLGIDILPPNINHSYRKFSVEKGAIRMGLSAVKGVGHHIIRTLVKERENGPYTDLKTSLERLYKHENNGVNKKAVEALILCGAMDDLGLNRAQMMAMYVMTIDSIAQQARKNLAGQTDMFAMFQDEGEAFIQAPNMAEFAKKDLLAYEKEFLGIYVTDHPFNAYHELVKDYIDYTTLDLAEYNETTQALDGRKVVMAGLVTKVRGLLTKKNQTMAFVTIEDLDGEMELVVFPEPYQKFRDLLKEDTAVYVYGQLQISDVEAPKMLVDSMVLIEDNADPKIQKSYNYSYQRQGQINQNSQEEISSSDPVNDYQKKEEGRETLFIRLLNVAEYTHLREILIQYPGTTKVRVYFDDSKITRSLKKDLYIDIENLKLLEALVERFGEENVKVTL